MKCDFSAHVLCRHYTHTEISTHLASVEILRGKVFVETREHTSNTYNSHNLEAISRGMKLGGPAFSLDYSRLNKKILKSCAIYYSSKIVI